MSEVVGGHASPFLWTWLAAPYLGCAVALFSLLVVAAIASGDRVIRIGLVSAAGSLLPWALCSALAMTIVDDLELARRLHQLGNGPTMFLGPSLFLVLLSVSGQLDRHRYIARAAIASGVVLLVLSWSTELVITGVTRLGSGVLFPSGGVLVWCHALQIVVWPCVGLAIAMRASSPGRRASAVRYLAALPLLAAVATSDTVIAYIGRGSYPLAWIPAFAGALLCLHLVWRADLLRGRGLEQVAVRALLARVIAGAALAAVVWWMAERGQLAPVAVALVTAPLWGVGLVLAWLVPRGAGQGGGGYEQALERFARELSADDTAAAQGRLAQLWEQHIGSTKVRLRQDLTRLDPATRAWLAELRAPLLAAEVEMMRLGRLRQAIVELFAELDAAVVVPIIDRGEILALAEAAYPAARPLRDAERIFLFDSAQLVGNVLTYARLAREARAAATAAREVDIANALAGHYRPLAAEDTGCWQLAVHHRASGHPGGDGWSWALLGPERIAVMAAETDTGGVAGALVIAALQGAFAARSRRPDCSAADLLDALGDPAPGSRRKTLVLVLDGRAREVTWASDGLYGAALLAPSGADHRLATRAHPRGSAPLPPHSLVLLLSSAVASAPGLPDALAAGNDRGLRLVAELLDLAAMASAQGASTERDLLAVGVTYRAGALA